jgi:4-carboxymuconolactone decarboxylase
MRVPHLTLEEMTPEQRRLYDAIAAGRARVGGPFAIWLRTPPIAEAANDFGNALRRDSRLDKRLFEIMVLVIAHRWGAQYEWFTHAAHARQAGVSDAVIESLREGRVPAFERDDERLVYEVTSELLQAKVLSDATYRRALDFFGLDLLIEFVTGVAFYTSVAVVLNAFDVPTPDGSKPLG